MFCLKDVEEDNDIQQIVTIVRYVVQLLIEGFIGVSVYLVSAH